MSSLADTSTWRPEISQAPRATLTIRMDAERDGAIPLADLAAIAKTVQDTIDRTARSLNDRSGGGRPPAFLSKLSALEAVGITSGSAVLEIEAPHDMDELPMAFDGTDAGVQAIELFVQSAAAVSRGEAPLAEIGAPASRSFRAFIKAIGDHDRVTIEMKARDTDVSATLVPRIVLIEEEQPVDETDTVQSVDIVGRLYGVNLHTRTYRVEDGIGKAHLLEMSDDLDDRGLRGLLGETVHVRAAHGGTDAKGADRLIATAISRVAAPNTSNYYTWNFEAALEGIEPLRSLEDLAIPGLSEDEADAFWHAVND